MRRACRILGSGVYLPKRTIYSEDLDARLGFPKGTVENKSGVKKRHYVLDETSVMMGALAAQKALEKAGLRPDQVDLIIGASGVPQQPIPCNAALLQRELGLEVSGIPSFDVNSTCLSFVTAFDMASYLIETGRFNNVLIVSSDIASIGIDYTHIESCSLFGDGAAAFVIGKSDAGQFSSVLSSRMETYSEAASFCEIKGGLSLMPAQRYTQYDPKDYLFRMDGTKVFKLFSRKLGEFTKKLFEPAKVTMSDLALVIPHQGSKPALEIIRRKLEVPEGKWMCNIENFGNTIASSIPIALHTAIEDRRILRGDLVYLMGTSAGASLGGIVLKY